MTRIALITGAASGIGLKIAERFADVGMTIALVDLDEGALRKVSEGLPGGGHRQFVCDVADEKQVVDLFGNVESAMGPVAVLVNNAGIIRAVKATGRPSIVETEAGEWDRIMAVNARGSFLTIRELLRRRTKQPVDNGRIINLGSSAAQIGGYNGSSAYVSSKGAVHSLTKIAAREAAPMGITVNAIAPGAIVTPLLRSAMPPERDAGYSEKVPMGRIGTAEDVAAAAVYLASAEASYVTGSCIDVNGGLRMQ